MMTKPLTVTLQRYSTISRYKLLLLVLFSIALLSCDSESQNQEIVKSVVIEPEEPTVPDVILEALNDASSYDMPRFQFQSRFGSREKYEIWSMKIDGSDIRLVLSAEELYRDGFSHLSQHMSRSPDGRYVALVQKPDEGNNARVLYDLKTRERTVMVKNSAVVPSIRWTEDSKQVLFYSWSYKESNAYLYQFDVKEKKLRKGPNNIDSSEFYPIKNDSEFIAITKQGFVRYDWVGKKLNEVKLAERIHTRSHAVSRNGKTMVYKLYKGAYPAFIVIHLNKPHEVLFSLKERSDNFMLDYWGNNLYYLGFGGINTVNLKTKTKSRILNSYDFFSGFHNLNLYNDKER